MSTPAENARPRKATVRRDGDAIVIDVPPGRPVVAGAGGSDAFGQDDFFVAAPAAEVQAPWPSPSPAPSAGRK